MTNRSQSSIAARRWAPALVLAALCWTSVAGAQGALGTGSHILSIGFGGGMSVPVGDAKDAFKNGVNGQGFLLVRLGPLPSLRFNLGYQRFNFKDALGISGHSEITSGVGALSFDLLPGPVRPYITAGLGAFNVKSAFDSTSAGTGPSSSDVNFGIDGGAGLSLNFGRVGAFAEGKVQNVYTKNGGLVNFKSIRTVPVSFGILVGL